jgi:ATP-binding cassette subfamily F protein 3
MFIVSICLQMNRTPQPLGSDSFYFMLHFKQIKQQREGDSMKLYKGTLLFISHDRYMLNRVPTKIVEMFSNKFEIYDGGYDYYLSHKRIEKVETIKKEQSENSKQYFKSKEQRAEEVKLQNRKKSLEKSISELEEKIKEIQEEMAKPEIAADYVELNKLCEEMEQYNQELEQKMEEWIELN